MTRTNTTELARMDDKGIVLATQGEVHEFAQKIVTTALCPKQYVGKPNDAMIAIIAGRGVGIGPIQALASIAVVNGRPSMYGEGRSAVVASRGQVEWIKEWWELNGKPTQHPQYATLNDYPQNLTACWQTKRKDRSEPSPVVRFSVMDAKAANLWGKQGPWCQYPTRMLQMRARAWGERDNYADALAGIQQAEEMMDIPKRGKDPLEAKLGSGNVIEGEVVPQDVPAEIVDPGAADAALQPDPDAPVTEADKLKLIDDVQQYIDSRGVAEPLEATKLIQAVVKDKGIGKVAKASHIADVRKDILAGAYDLETGYRIPAAAEDEIPFGQ